MHPFKKTKVKFNWIFSRKATVRQLERCVDLEYQLRPKIMRFLLEHFGNDECSEDNFSCFHFDVYVETELVYMNQNTPDEFLTVAENKFDLFFNGDKSLAKAL